VAGAWPGGGHSEVVLLKSIERIHPMLRALILASVSLVAAAALAIPVLAAPSAQTIRVNEVEYRISLSAKPKAGVARFVVRNAGDDGHDFWIKGGGKTWKTRVLGGGNSASLTAKLKKGVKYTYWCGVSDHASEGMRGSFVAR
jgi:Copper binding proteins, plastocyanin/azurin family